ncbi:MAG: alpha/beta hydrolase [Ardenticatenaceae bacterium]
MSKKVLLFGSILFVLILLLMLTWFPIKTEAQASVLPPLSSNIKYVPCSRLALSADPSLTCAYVAVPEDHFDPDNDETIRIAVAVVKASSSNPQPDPVIYLQGGPGQSSVDIALPLTKYFLGLEHASRDIVYIDQRGVGRSTPNLSCYAELEPFVLEAWKPPYTDEKFVDQYFTSLRACIERLKAQGITLSAYTSAQNAADIIAVAKALGYEQQINLYGISYGARLALTILRDFGDTGYIRSAVIGGVYGPEANALEFAINLHQRTELLFDACEKDAACNQAYPDLRARFYAFVAQLDQNPLTLDVTLPTGHTIKAQADEMALYYYLFKQFVIGQTVIGQLPQQLDAILSTAQDLGNTAILAQGIHGQANDLLYGQNLGMNTLVQCQEEFLLLTPQEIAYAERNTPAQSYGFVLRFQESSLRYPEFCASLGLQPTNPIEAQAVTSNIPTLVISGRFDPLTPPEWANRSTAAFPNRYIYTLENAGHDSAAAYNCAQPMVHDFFTNPTQAPNSACVAQQTIQFALPGQ